MNPQFCLLAHKTYNYLLSDLLVKSLSALDLNQWLSDFSLHLLLRSSHVQNFENCDANPAGVGGGFPFLVHGRATSSGELVNSTDSLCPDSVHQNLQEQGQR